MNLSSDFKVGLRQVGKRPGSALLAVAAYSVGLGLVGLMLSFIFGVVRAHPDDIDFDAIQTLRWDASTRHLWKSGSQHPMLRYRDFAELRQEQEAFESLAAIRDSDFSIRMGDYAQRFSGNYVTAEFFAALSLKPQLGRFFEAGDDAPHAPRKAVLSDHLWRQHFKANPDLVGQHLTINGVPTLVIGIAGKDVDFPSTKYLWVNETIDPLAQGRSEGQVYFVFGQLKPEHTQASALAELNAIAKRFEDAYPESNTGYVAFELNPLSHYYLGDDTRRMFYLLLACSFLVLFIACANVANLTLARAANRVKELAIRSSLGGNRSRLVAQMVVEGFALAIIGGLFGLLLTIWSGKALWAWITKSETADVPLWMNIDVDLKVVAALSLATLAASVAASIVPALKASRASVNEILKDSSRGATGLKIGLFSKLLALFQLCLSCGLLIATSAMVSTARETAVYQPPYDPESMLVARFDLPEAYAANDNAGVLPFLERLRERIAASSPLQDVGFTSSIDMLFNWDSRWEARGRETQGPEDYFRARHEIVSDDYFELLGIPILHGRGFESTDGGENAAQACIVNEPLAKTLWPGESPIGKQIRDVWSDSNPWITVIGVVPDTKMAGPGPKEVEELGGVYRPLSAAPQTSLTLFARAPGNPTDYANALRAAVSAEDPSVALYRVKTVAQAVRDANFAPLFYRNMFAIFGAAALALASIGVYGVMDFSVRQRFQEFGIRQALGASKATIMRHVFRLGAAQIAIGLALGAVLGWALLSVVGQAIGVLSASPLNYAIPLLAIGAVAAVALFTPAREVTQANLAHRLRDE